MVCKQMFLVVDVLDTGEISRCKDLSDFDKADIIVDR